MRLRQLREDLDLTQRQVGERMGVSEQRVGAIEATEVGRLKLSTVRRYIGALGGTVRFQARLGEETVQLRFEQE